MRSFEDMTLKEFFELLEKYAECQSSLLERVEFNFWQNYEPVIMLSRGSKPARFVTHSSKSKLEQAIATQL